MSQIHLRRPLSLGPWRSPMLGLAALLGLLVPGPSGRSLGDLAQAFLAAHGQGDRDGMMALWDASSPYLADGREALQRELAAKDALGQGSVRRLRTDGDKGTARLVFARGAQRNLHAVQRSGEWRLWKYATVEEDLVDAVLAARSEAERRAALAAEGDWDGAALRRALDARGVSLTRAGRPADALAPLQLALSFPEPAPDTVAAGNTLVNLAIAQSFLGDFGPALEHGRRALALAEAASDKRLTVRALAQIGHIHLEQDDYEPARAEYRRALALAEEMSERTLVLQFLTNLGTIAQYQGDLGTARDCFQRALAQPEAVGEMRRVPLMAMGNVHLHQGDYARALALHQEALAMAESTHNQRGLSFSLQNIGAIYSSEGNYPRAIDYLKRGLGLSQEMGMKPRIAALLIALGEVYFKADRRGEALEAFERALSLSREGGSKRTTATTLEYIGELRGLEGDAAGAAAALDEASKLAEEMGSKDAASSIRLTAAIVRRRQGQHRQALELAREAVTLARQVERNEDLWLALWTMGQAHQALGQPAEARRALSEAVEVIEHLREQASGGEEDRERYFETLVAPYQDLVQVLTEQGEVAQALVYAERAKGRVLLDVLQSGRADLSRALGPEELRREQELRGAQRALNTQVYRELLAANPDSGRLDELRARLQTARHEAEAFESTLYADHPGLRLERGEIRPLALEEAGALMSGDASALLEYVVTEERTYLFVLTPAERRGAPPRVEVHRLEVSKAELTQQVRSFRERLSERSLAFHPLARQLYERLLGPAAPRLRGRSVVGIVPDDVLWELPFQALEPGPGRYVLEDCAVFYAPSLSVLREMRAQASRRRPASRSPRLFALGNPALELGAATRERARERGLALGDLPEAEDEVRRLGHLYGASRSAVYTGRQAREEVVKQEIGRYQVAHLAAHAVLDDVSPLYSHILLAQGGAPGGEDGLLEAWEVMKMNLAARLVVLSACQTARGRVGPGEGLVGMSWAFFIAGAPATVVSQWPVDSAATRELMVQFHRGLLEAGRSLAPAAKAEELRRAALKVSRQPGSSHPFYWAPFVMVGDGGSP